MPEPYISLVPRSCRYGNRYTPFPRQRCPSELTAAGKQLPPARIAFVLISLFRFFLPTVSTKALAGAKSLGGFLYSAVNKAGKTVVEASAKIKKTVEENVSFSTVHSYNPISGDRSVSNDPSTPPRRRRRFKSAGAERNGCTVGIRFDDGRLIGCAFIAYTSPVPRCKG